MLQRYYFREEVNNNVRYNFLLEILQRYYFHEEANNNVRYNFLLDNVTKVLFSLKKKFGTVIC